MQRLTLSYISPEIEENNITNEATDSKNILNFHREGVNNTNIDICLSQRLDSFFILYLENQPAKPKFCDDATLLIFLFRTNEFIEISLNNILMLLLRIADFMEIELFKVNLKRTSLLL